MEPKSVEKGFLKRTWPLIFQMLKEEGHVLTLSLIVYTAVSYVLMALTTSSSDALAGVRVGLIIIQSVISGGMGTVFILFLIYLSAKANGTFKGSVFSLVLTAVSDAIALLKSSAFSYIVFLMFTSSIEFTKKDASTKEVVATAVSPLFDFLFQSTFAIPAIMGIFLGLMVVKPIKLYAFAPITTLTTRYFGVAFDQACIAGHNAETKNRLITMRLSLFNMVIAIAGLLFAPVIGLVFYTLYSCVYYYLWHEIFIGPGLLKKAEQDEFVGHKVLQKI